jgi:hypothetical protein
MVFLEGKYSAGERPLYLRRPSEAKGYNGHNCANEAATESLGFDSSWTTAL